MDLGSAVLSAQMALDLLPQEISSKVRICSAPLVEGAVAAGVQISLESPMDMVFSEAIHALVPKQNQLEQGEDLQPAVTPLARPEEEHVEVMLRNMHGLHARPAARFVQKAGSFNAEITVKDLTNGKGPVSARSLNAIATLGAVEGHHISIAASGEQAGQALMALQALVEIGVWRTAGSGNGRETARIRRAEAGAQVAGRGSGARGGRLRRIRCGTCLSL